MSADQPQLAPVDAFPAVTAEEWARRVREELEGKDLESLERPSATGLSKRPLYTRSDLPVVRPGGRRNDRGWVRVVPWTGEIDAASEREGGAGGVESPIEAAGSDTDGLELFLESHARTDLPPARVGGYDPLGALARDGRLGVSLEEALAAAPDVARAADDGQRPLRVDPGHHRRTGAVDELALAAATVTELARAGVPPALLARRTALSFGIGPDLFDELAKLRAARLVWSRLFGALGERSVAPPWIHAVTDRGGWDDDVLLNALRATFQTCAAALGGADSIRVDPPGPTRADGRLARNLQNVLAEEAALGRVADPAGGSWYVERRSADLARAAWDRFRAIERDGGLARRLREGKSAAPEEVA